MACRGSNCTTDQPQAAFFPNIFFEGSINGNATSEADPSGVQLLRSFRKPLTVRPPLFFHSPLSIGYVVSQHYHSHSAFEFFRIFSLSCDDIKHFIPNFSRGVAMIQSVRFRSFFMATCSSLFFVPTAVIQPFCVHTPLMIQVHSNGSMPLRPNPITLSHHDCIVRFQPSTFFRLLNLMSLCPFSPNSIFSMTALKRQIWEAVSEKQVTELTGTVF